MQTLTHKTLGVAAFKEWAVSCKALGEGEQVMIFRKGGISERGKVFHMEHPHFFLYPTYEHQADDGIKAEYLPLLKSAMDEKPELGEVKLHYWAQVDEALPLSDMAPVLKQQANHIYSESSVQTRWQWQSSKPLWLLLLRVYKLKEPVTLEVLEDYTGCRSWIDLANLPVPDGLACEPVLSDEAYAAKAAKVRELL